LDFFLQKPLEVNVVYEEWVLLDLLSAVYSKSFRGISVEKTSQNAASFCANVGAEDEWIGEDLLVHLVRDLWGGWLVVRGVNTGIGQTIIEGWETGKHLIEKYAKGPPINCLVWSTWLRNYASGNEVRLTISVTIQDLWCKIFRCATERVRRVRVLHVELTQPEVAQCDVSGIIEKDVFWLQIAVVLWAKHRKKGRGDVHLPVDHIEFMQVFQSQ
jgi:hypothetical protein